MTSPVPKILPDATATGRAAGLAAADALRRAVDTGGTARVMFASAPSQDAMLDTLVREAVPWEAIHAFHMDEYIGIPPEHPQSFGQWLSDRLPPGIGGFDRILPGDDPSAEQARYADLLAEPLDLVCLGIGVNGHIAFNEPGSSFEDPERVRRIELDAASRRQQVDDG